MSVGEKNRESCRKWRKKNKENHRHWRKKMSPIALKAWRAIQQRVYTGRLQRQPCVICSAPDADAHHEDYSKPLAIVWLCEFHHAAVHKGEITISPEQICHV